MRFEFRVKLGVKGIVYLPGRLDLSPEHVTIADQQKIIETEQFLERIFGYRFHINEMQGTGGKVENKTP